MGMHSKGYRKHKAKLLQHLGEEVYCQLGKSAVHGVGVFAIRRIPRGVNPLRAYKKHGEIRYSKKELRSLPHPVRKLIDKYCYYENGTVLVPELGLNTMDLALYVNHSRKPNVALAKDDRLETLRAIAVGEELTMNYDVNFGGEHFF
jgi:SET domain-containing protein